MNEKELNRKKPPKYVGVYTKILEMIQEGLYPQGAAIPSEPDLARQMGVSRMTLRQALALLQEDGIIETKHGLGNFVRGAAVNGAGKEGIERMGNPVYKCLNEAVERVETEYRLDVSDSYTKMLFQRETAVFIGVTRRYYIGAECSAFSFSYLPADIEEVQAVDLSKSEELEKFLDEDIYKRVYSSHIEVKGITGDKAFADETALSGGENTLLFTESLVNSVGDILVYTKYSVPLKRVEFQIHQFQ